MPTCDGVACASHARAPGPRITGGQLHIRAQRLLICHTCGCSVPRSVRSGHFTWLSSGFSSRRGPNRFRLQCTVIFGVSAASRGDASAVPLPSASGSTATCVCWHPLSTDVHVVSRRRDDRVRCPSSHQECFWLSRDARRHSQHRAQRAGPPVAAASSER
jgi:hypothetical protein